METWMVTGVTGFLGPRVVEELKKDSGKKVLAVSRKEMDFSKEDEVKRVFETCHPNVLVHVGAVADGGICERDPEGSKRINVDGVEYLAKAAAAMGTKMIFASSDQVYGGSDVRTPHKESEVLAPATVYGRQKLQGEELVEKYCRDGISLRLTWMYDLPGNLPVKPNFLTNLFRALETGEALTLSAYDYRGVTDGRVVAERITRLKDVPGGVYNFGSPNALNFYETALETLKLLGRKADACLCRDPEERWRNLAFTTEKLEAAGLAFPDTLTGIRECLERYHCLG